MGHLAQVLGSLAILTPILMGLPGCMEEDNTDNRFSEVRKLSSTVNSTALDAGPEISIDERSLFFHSDRSGGLGNQDLYVATRNHPNEDWQTAVNLGVTINSPADDRAATISSDGLLLVFASNRGSVSGDYDLYMSSRPSVDSAWEQAVNLGNVINTQFNESGPSLSGDGLTLVFHADLPDTLGFYDLYVSYRASTIDPWSPPVNMGRQVNSVAHDVAADISADGLQLYFHSGRSGSPGAYSIWQSQRSSVDGEWQPATLMEAPVNSNTIETGPSISADGRSLYFASDRTDSRNRDIWLATR